MDPGPAHSTALETGQHPPEQGQHRPCAPASSPERPQLQHNGRMAEFPIRSGKEVEETPMGDGLIPRVTPPFTKVVEAESCVAHQGFPPPTRASLGHKAAAG